MGLFDLPAPLFAAIDRLGSLALPGVVRLALWGLVAGWLTMLIYRALSSQEKIRLLKGRQQELQREIAGFDGEFTKLFPLIRHTLGLGLRQLGLSLGPALLATVPVLFLIVWVAGEFGYRQPAPGAEVRITTDDPGNQAGSLNWSPPGVAQELRGGWRLEWPGAGQTATLSQPGFALITLPARHRVTVIHKRRWWNRLMANPLGYLPPGALVEAIHIGLPPQQFLPFGPGWLRGWMFTFFLSFLLSSVGFKLALKID